LPGDVVRYANRLPTASELNPHVLANPMQRLIVGSSVNSSAVEGLSMMNRTWGPLSQQRQSANR